MKTLFYKNDFVDYQVYEISDRYIKELPISGKGKYGACLVIR